MAFDFVKFVEDETGSKLFELEHEVPWHDREFGMLERHRNAKTDGNDGQ